MERLRLIESAYISEEVKEKLRAKYEKLNPRELYREIKKYQRMLERAYLEKKGLIPKRRLTVNRRGLK
ncbi:MAG: hypothetical protein ACPLSN_08360 [Dictyoglomus turgidum]